MILESISIEVDEQWLLEIATNEKDHYFILPTLCDRLDKKTGLDSRRILTDRTDSFLEIFKEELIEEIKTSSMDSELRSLLDEAA